MTIKISELGPEDYVDVLRIAKLAFGSRTPPPLAIAAYLVLSDGVGVKAIVAGRVVGFAIAEVKGWLGHVLLVAVEPGFQGKGVGRRLMENLEERMVKAGAKVSRLEVLLGDRAVFFYERLGYVRVSVVEDYYPYGDAVVMEKSLT